VHTILTLKSCRADVRIRIGKTEEPGANKGLSASEYKHTSAVLASIYAALKPDVGAKGKLAEPGTKAKISLEQKTMIFNIRSNDIATLRASLNSYLRLADASYKCIAG
jgi:tRNA threonylcarbamoyladenosine modification (KEOPS) complex  Pcc1 subunit